MGKTELLFKNAATLWNSSTIIKVLDISILSVLPLIVLLQIFSTIRLPLDLAFRPCSSIAFLRAVAYNKTCKKERSKISMELQTSLLGQWICGSFWSCHKYVPSWNHNLLFSKSYVLLNSSMILCPKSLRCSYMCTLNLINA